MKKQAENRLIEEILIDARFQSHKLGKKEEKRALRQLLNKLDWSKSASDQPAFPLDNDSEDGHLNLLLSKLAPKFKGEINLLKKDNPSNFLAWRFLVVSLALSKKRFLQAKEWKPRLSKKETQKELFESFLTDIRRREKLYKPNRNKISSRIDTYFNWLEPHTQKDFAYAIVM